MKYIFYSFLCTITSLSTITSSHAADRGFIEDIIPRSSKNVLTVGTDGETADGFLDAILFFIRDTIFGLLGLIAIAMFLYIGGRLIVARGNPEEFKKALTSFVYAAVGLVLVAAAFAIVRLIVGLDI